MNKENKIEKDIYNKAKETMLNIENIVKHEQLGFDCFKK